MVFLACRQQKEPIRSGTENINKTVFQVLYSAIAERGSRHNKPLPCSERVCVTAEAGTTRRTEEKGGESLSDEEMLSPFYS